MRLTIEKALPVFDILALICASWEKREQIFAKNARRTNATPQSIQSYAVLSEMPHCYIGFLIQTKSMPSADKKSEKRMRAGHLLDKKYTSFL